MQVLSEPNVNRRELRGRAKAVRKLGQAFYDVNRTPAQRGSATSLMEELASVMQVSHSCDVAPTAHSAVMLHPQRYMKLHHVLGMCKRSSFQSGRQNMPLWHTCSAI